MSYMKLSKTHLSVVVSTRTHANMRIAACIDRHIHSAPKREKYMALHLQTHECGDVVSPMICVIKFFICNTIHLSTRICLTNALYFCVNYMQALFVDSM